MYSKFDSPSTPYDIVRRCAEIGTRSVALTDHGSLLGIEPFFDAEKKVEKETGKNINVVPGVEAYMQNREHLILIAKNDHGYDLIAKAMKDANRPENIVELEDMLFPIMTDEIIEKWFSGSNDVIATSACIAGPIAKILLSGKRAKEKKDKFQKKLEEFRNSYESYELITAQKQKIKEDKASLKKETAARKKYLNKSFERAIERQQKKLDSLDESDINRRSIAGDLSNMIMLRDGARQFMESAKKLDADLNRKSKVLTAEKKKHESGHKSYIRFKAKYDSIVVNDEQHLYEKALQRAQWLGSVFPNFYIEMQNHGLADEAYVMPISADIAEKLGIPLIASNDAHVVRNSQKLFEARRIMRYNYFSTPETISDSDRRLYIMTDEEMKSSLLEVLDESKANQALANTGILDECHVEHKAGKHYPRIDDGPSFDQLLSAKRQEMIDMGKWSQTYEDRLKREVNVIKSMGYVDYHMVVRDFCIAGREIGKVPKDRLSQMPRSIDAIRAWRKENGYDIGVGIGLGRGSAAGSLVCYMLGITNVDPIRYDLLFERFLNPERVSMPDIDTDVASQVRPYLIRYIKDRYGENAVCSIATETTYGAKSAIQMAGRERAAQLFGTSSKSKDLRSQYAREVTEPLSGIIPEEPGRVLERPGEEKIDPRKRKGCRFLFENYIAAPHPTSIPGIDAVREASILWSHAKLIEGKLCATGVHAGGIVISDNDDISDHIPLAYNPKKNVWVAQCDMIKVEERGMLKMDLLGLNTLGIITDCLWLIKKHCGVSIDTDAIPFEKEVFKNIYCRGFTNSVFQFESPGMKDLLRRFQPSNIDDLILLNAVFRPGPLQYIDGIIETKRTGHAPESCLTKIPQLREILEPTYMSIIYQEQIMLICQKLAGYSLGQADNVRKYMSKKKEKLLKAERRSFVYGDSKRNIKGCVANGINEQLANELFDQMLDFASYCFNKSHAACYSINSYITAWLKYHYPKEYLCAVFNNKKSDEYAPVIEDCAVLGIDILQPDINRSRYDFTVEEGGIRYGFRGIKGIGEANIPTIEAILHERRRDPENSDRGGQFKSFQDFIGRCLIEDRGKLSTLPKDIAHKLILAGCFDFAGASRRMLCAGYPKRKSVDLEKMSRADAEIWLQEHTKKLSASPVLLCEEENMKDDVELLGMVMNLSMLREASAGLTLPSEAPEDVLFPMAGIIISHDEGKTLKGTRYSYLEVQTLEGMKRVALYGDVCKKYVSALDDMLCKPKEFIIEKHNGYLSARRISQLRQPMTFTITVSTKEQLESAKTARKRRKGQSRRDRNCRAFLVLRCNDDGEPDGPRFLRMTTDEEGIQEMRESGAIIVRHEVASLRQNP
jgi:DNA polymerase-3 subunit alpha